MPDPIKSAFQQGDSLHFVRDGEVLSVKAQDGKEPNEWTVIHFANVGTSEVFVEAFSGELLELVDASSIHGAERDALKNAIMTVLLEGLMPAFEHLKKIRTSIASPSLITNVLPRRSGSSYLVTASPSPEAASVACIQ